MESNNPEYNSNNCISGIQLLDYVSDFFYPMSNMSPEEKAKIKRHIEKCEFCRKQVAKSQKGLKDLIEKVKRLNKAAT